MFSDGGRQVNANSLFSQLLCPTERGMGGRNPKMPEHQGWIEWWMGYAQIPLMF